MVKLDEIHRTSTFAWSTDVIPLLASGTVAGAVDASFNSSSSLELWDIFSPTNKKEPLISADVDNRFHALAWSKPFDGRSKGLLVGAFENGTIEFWDAEVLIRTKNLAQASVHKSTKHKGAVKALHFNPLLSHILVSGGAHGEIFVWDTKTFAEPFAPGTAMTPADDITSVAWNNSVSHIFASTSGSYTSIWDLKTKREVLHLSYSGSLGRANFSSVAWHPSQSTKLITASDNDGSPLILTWDLRNSNEPEKILQGHGKGVLSLDWCKQDPELLISSGKDNATFLWNPITGEKLGQYPTTANWAFHTRFAPLSPEIFATASFDGKIIVQSLQDTSPPVSTKVNVGDDNEFWNEISTTDTQQPEFVKSQAPSWLKNPSSVSFGFGAKLVSLTTVDGKSVIDIGKFTATNFNPENLSKAITDDDFSTIIDEKLLASDKVDWLLLKKLASEGKDKLFSTAVEGEKKEKFEPEIKPEAENFFESLGNGNAVPSFVPQGEFSLFGDSDKELTRLILNNKIEQAVTECLKLEKLEDALVLALDASPSIKEKVKNAYFNKNNSQLSRVIYSASSKNVVDIVSNADIGDWKDIASSISAYSADLADYNAKIIELGDRVLAASPDKRNDAILCYLAGDALEKVGAIWLKELPDYEKNLLKENDDVKTPSDARLGAVTNFVEKLSAYKSVAKLPGSLSGPGAEAIAKIVLEFSNLLATSGSFELAQKFLDILPEDLEGLKLEKERLAKATGKSATSSAAKTKTRAAKYSSSPAVKPATLRQPSFNQFVPQHQVPPQAGNPVAPAARPPVPQPAKNLYTPATPQTYGAPAAPYAGQNAYASNPYAQAAPSPYGPAGGFNGVTSPQPSAPAPPKNKYKEETDGWNDLPQTFKAKAAPPRRAAAAVVASSPSPAPSTPPVPSAGFPPRKPSAPSPGPPPPAKGQTRSASRGTLNSATSSPQLGGQAQVNRRYAPPPSLESAAPVVAPPAIGSGVPRPTTPSSYALPKNPYAPTASVSSPAKNPYAPPPTASQAPAASPFPPTPAVPQPQFGGLASSQPPLRAASVVSPPPKNPYAPTASATKAAPAARFGGVAPTPPNIASQPPAAGIAPPPARSAPPPATGIAPPPPVAPPASVVPPPPAASEQDSASLTVIVEALRATLAETRPKVPEKYTKHVEDVETRLKTLFEELNNNALSPGAIESLKQVSTHLQSKDYKTAGQLIDGFPNSFPQEAGVWHIGVKRLISMAEAV